MGLGIGFQRVPSQRNTTPPEPTANANDALAPHTPVSASVVPEAASVHGAAPDADCRMTPFCPTAKDNPLAESDQAPNKETSVSPSCSTTKETGLSGRGAVVSSQAANAPGRARSENRRLTTLRL